MPDSIVIIFADTCKLILPLPGAPDGQCMSVLAKSQSDTLRLLGRVATLLKALMMRVYMNVTVAHCVVF